MQEPQDINQLRNLMDFIVQSEEDESYDQLLLTFIENSLFLESAAHNWHLQSKHYTKHLQLDELYKELPEFIDAFIEGIMESRGPLVIGTGNNYQFTEISTCITTLEEYLNQCEAIHQMLESNEDYGSTNTLEDIMSFIDGVLYKLKHLQ